MELDSIQVGQPRIYANGEPWETAIFKTPVSGPIHLGTVNLEGDAQADLTVHGGPDKAVNVYPLEHYQYWKRRTLPWLRPRVKLPASVGGAFGENFSVWRMLEDAVCIGDIFTIGEAIVQVSQPRQPCWKLARKWNQPELPLRVVKSGRTGWYFRVLQTGSVSAGQRFMLTERPFPQWTLQQVNRLQYDQRADRKQIEQIAQCAALSASWRESFEQRLAN